MKKIMIYIIIIIAIIIPGVTFKKLLVNPKLDKEKFAKEYTSVSKDNVFVYKNLENINKILKNGTGIVYLGFSECPWCMEYVKYLNEVAKDNNIKEIYYFNIKEAREQNSKEYQTTVKLLSKYLQYDREGNKRVYVPAVIAINKGKIVGYDDETAWDTKGYKTPKEYWQKEDLKGLKEKLATMFNKTKPSYCDKCNAK